MRLIYLIAANISIFTSIGAVNARACSCNFPGSPQAALGRAEVAFMGTVVSTSEKTDANTRARFSETRFYVMSWWKGGSNEEIVVRPVF